VNAGGAPGDGYLPNNLTLMKQKGSEEAQKLRLLGGD